MKTYEEYRGVRFHSAGQLWSNTALRYQAAGVMPMMVQPAFLDLVRLAAKFPIDHLLEINNTLLAQALIERFRHAENAAMLTNIAIGLERLHFSESPTLLKTSSSRESIQGNCFNEVCKDFALRADLREICHLWRFIHQNEKPYDIAEIFACAQSFAPHLPYEHFRFRLLNQTLSNDEKRLEFMPSSMCIEDIRCELRDDVAQFEKVAAKAILKRIRREQPLNL